MNYEQKYNEALEKARKVYDDISPENSSIKKILEKAFPELRDSEDERIRKEIIKFLHLPHQQLVGKRNHEEWISWLEKQGNIDFEFFENGENEKREFVGYGFLKCKGDFLSFKEGETYWLEYVGKDNYNVRSDNLLGQTFHITPQQLYTVFRPTTWLEKQDESIKIKKGKNYLCTKTHKYAGVEWIEGVKYYSPGDYSLVNQGCICYCPKYSKEEHNNFFKEVEYDGCLEKQGEQRSITIDADKMASKYSHTKDGDFGLPVNCQIRAYRQGVNDVLNLLLGIEKQGEQEEPQVYETENGEIITYSETDGYKVVEPKFKVGDWIVWQDKCYKVNYNGCGYELFDQNGLSTSWGYKTIEDNAHLWTIQDAIDGDVLTNDFNEIFIFKNINEDIVISHCSIIDRTSDAIVNSFDEVEVGSLSVVNFYPATKKQRDTLMKSMADAGYTFDFEKKEVRKIKQKPAEWSEEDEKNLQGIIDLLPGLTIRHTWLKSLKDRIQPKQEWSEEDERLLSKLQTYVDLECFDRECNGQDLINWLKSLRHQNTWKPSEEQMKYLHKYAEQNNYDGTVLTSLLNDLKKLKE